MPAYASKCRECKKQKEEEISTLRRVVLLLNGQNHRNTSIILLLVGLLWLTFIFAFPRDDYYGLERFSFCSKCIKERRPQEHKDKLLALFENQLARHEVLIRVYANYFRLPETVINEAIKDDQLWRNVKNVFELESSQLHWSLSNNLSRLFIGFINSSKNEVAIDTNKSKIDSQNSKNVYDDFVLPPQLYHKVVVDSKNTSDEIVPNFDFETVEENKASVGANTLPYKFTLSGIEKLKSLFKNLTGCTVSNYLEIKTPLFKFTGNLNLWKYFFDESSNNEIFNLERNTTLENNPSNGNFSCSMSDSYPARMSADNKYILYDKLINGSKFVDVSHESKITITTQMSMDRLHTFVQSYKYWNGPISSAVFLNGPMEYFLLRSYLSYMKRCYPNQFEKTRFSIATPMDDPIPRGVFVQSKDFDVVACSAKPSEINTILKKRLDKSNRWLKTKWYPQNMMRNLARVNVITDYHITLDVDIMPCPKMSEKIHKFLSRKYMYTNALVVPTYEVSFKVEFPTTKLELVTLTKKGLAQPFHRDVYLPNQNATNFPKWEKVHDSFDDVHVVHEIHKFPIHYEPFFIELNSSPMYDEGFVGYGFTRSSHAYEMFVKYGNFLILSPIYTVQLGIQKIKEWSDARQQQNEYNRIRFDIFVKNLTSQYFNLLNSTNKPNSNNKLIHIEVFN